MVIMIVLPGVPWINFFPAWTKDLAPAGCETTVERCFDVEGDDAELEEEAEGICIVVSVFSKVP